MIIKIGNLLDATEDIIIQQCNCLSVKPHGLSKSIADAFDHGNYYGSRKAIGMKNLSIQEDRDEPGSIVILYGENKPHIGCLMGQWQMGKINSHYYKNEPGINNHNDTKENRELWFKNGLIALGEWCTDEKITSVAFPYGIGCGLAGGNWKNYLRMINDFDKEYKSIDIVIYKL